MKRWVQEWWPSVVAVLGVCVMFAGVYALASEQQRRAAEERAALEQERGEAYALALDLEDCQAEREVLCEAAQAGDWLEDSWHWTVDEHAARTETYQVRAQQLLAEQAAACLPSGDRWADRQRRIGIEYGWLGVEAGVEVGP